MAQNRNATYGERWNPPSDNAPQGSFRNKTSETALDGSYLTAGWANDALDGWQGAMLHQASGEPSNYVEPTFPVTLNGNVDTAQNSQVYNAWYKKTQDVADGRIAAKQLEEKIAELQTIADGCYIYWYGQTNAFPANYNDFINFETKNDPSALNDPVSKSSNVTIDNDEITFLVGGSYSILFNVFADSTTVGFTTAGTTTKFFLNYSGNSPSTDTPATSLSGDSGYFAASGASVFSIYEPAITSTGIISPVALSPEKFINVNKNDVLKIYTELPNVSSILFNINRVGKANP